MGILSRLFSVGKSQANSIIDKFEDPIKMTEQGIKDLKKDLMESMKGLAQVKSLAIRARREADEAKKILADYDRKAMLLLRRAKDGAMDMSEAERLASEALMKKEEYSQKALTLENNARQYEPKATQLQGNVERLKSTISKYENELTTLKARAKTAACTRKVNEQLAKVDSSGTIAMLEKMKQKVAEDESLADAYGDMAVLETSVDQEINKALAETSTSNLSISSSNRLAELKSKMGI